MRARAAPLLVLLLPLASAGRAAAADVEAANPPPVWLTDASGRASASASIRASG